jgi:hypothetical protein
MQPDAAAVVGVGLASQPAGPFQPVDQPGHRG